MANRLKYDKAFYEKYAELLLNTTSGKTIAETLNVSVESARCLRYTALRMFPDRIPLGIQYNPTRQPKTKLKSEKNINPEFPAYDPVDEKFKPYINKVTNQTFIKIQRKKKNK